MGTLSKRGIEEFGDDVKERIEGFRSSVGRKLDGVSSRASTPGPQHGAFARKVERLTKALPATTWLGLAGLSALGSIGLKLLGRSGTASFVAAWVPTFLVLGLINQNPHAHVDSLDLH